MAWLNAAARPGGSSSSAAPRPSRPQTRRTFVSTAASSRPKANDATAAAVYGPTPGSSVRSSGHPSRATTAQASCRRSARRL